MRSLLVAKNNMALDLNVLKSISEVEKSFFVVKNAFKKILLKKIWY